MVGFQVMVILIFKISSFSIILKIFLLATVIHISVQGIFTIHTIKYDDCFTEKLKFINDLPVTRNRPIEDTSDLDYQPEFDNDFFSQPLHEPDTDIQTSTSLRRSMRINNKRMRKSDSDDSSKDAEEPPLNGYNFKIYYAIVI